MTLRVTWNGDTVKGRMDEIAHAAVDETTTEALRHIDHPGWQSVTGAAERSIQRRPAERRGKAWVGIVGSFGVPHFIFLEIGSRSRAGDHTIRRMGDKTFPTLPRRIAARAKAER